MQHCPTCVAENDDDAQFCAECGAPLDVQIHPDPADDDQTILSTNISADIVEGQKTEIFKPEEENDDDMVVVSQEIPDEVIVAESEPPIANPEIGGSPPSGGTNGGSDSSGGGLNQWLTQRNLIIGGIILLVLLCCCCCSPTIIGSIYFEDLDALMRELGQLSTYFQLV